MNGALMQQPSASNFASWPTGWRMSDLASYYDEVKARFSITATPSADGKHYAGAGHDVLRNALEKQGFQSDGSTDRPSKGHMGIPKVTASGGVRQSTASVYLPDALEHPGFQLRTGAEVSAIVHDGYRASGVRFSQEGMGSEVASLKAGGVLVLAGGAFNTPRLLLASGIGPAGAVANSHVGRGLSDHTITMMTYRLPEAAGISAWPLTPPSEGTIAKYAHEQSGGLAQFGPTLAAFIRNPETPGDATHYDVEAFVNPAAADNELLVWFVLMRPQCSTANLQLAGNSVRYSSPNLHLGCEQDVRTMQHAVDVVTNALAGSRATPLPSKSWWLQSHRVGAMNHWVGTCALGTCVDPRTLIVRGTENVAVVDASLLPGQVWGHPALTLKAVALKAGDTLAARLNGQQQNSTKAVWV